MAVTKRPVVHISTSDNPRFQRTIASRLVDRRQRTQRTQVAIGYFSEHRYPDGKPVAYVAAIQEFGHPASNIPMRAFMRRANIEGKETAARMIKTFSKRTHGGISDQAARFLGAYMVGLIKQTIERWSIPPNAPFTVERKGFNNPLIETRHMQQSVTAKIEHGDAK